MTLSNFGTSIFFISLVILLSFTVVLYGASLKAVTVLFVTSLLALAPLITLSLDEGQKFLNKLFQIDLAGVSLALFYTILLTAIIFIGKIPANLKLSPPLTFISVVGVICLFFVLAHKRQKKDEFTLRDYLLLLGLVILHGSNQVRWSPQNVTMHPYFIAFSITLDLLPCAVALIIYLAKRNIARAALAYDFRINFLDFVYLIVFLSIQILILLISGYSFEKFLSGLSLKYFIFKASLMALVTAIPEEIFFRAFLINILLRFFKDRVSDRSRLTLALFVSSLCFGIYHIRQGFWPVFWATVAGLIFGLFFIKRRRLSGPIILHSIYNAILWN